MPRVIQWMALSMVAVYCGGCAPISVSSHSERGLDVTRYHSFSWAQADGLPVGDPRLEKDPFFKDRFEGAVERQFAGRGIRLVATDPDLLIHYHATIASRIDVNRGGDTYGSCVDADCAVRTIDYEEGTLVLDIVDAHTQRLIWRGWAQRAIGDELENRDHLARRIDEAVTRMLARFRSL